MHKIIIKTKYNVIILEREDYDPPVLAELLADIEEARIEKIKAKTSILVTSTRIIKGKPKENE